ncbi:hypothetical protein PG989_003904 [Apiospora arundinis]
MSENKQPPDLSNFIHIMSRVPPNHAGIISVPSAMMYQARDEYEKIARELEDTKKKAEAYKNEAETYKSRYEGALKTPHGSRKSTNVPQEVSSKFTELASKIFQFCQRSLRPDTSIATEGEERRDYSDVSRSWRQYILDRERAPFFLSALIWRHLFLEVLLLGPGVWGAEAQNNTTSFYNWLKGQSGMNEEILGLVESRVDSGLDQPLTTSPDFLARVSTALWIKLYAHIPLSSFDLNVEQVRTMVRDACKLSIMADSCGVNMVYPQRAFDPLFTLPFDENKMQSVKTTRSDGKVDLCVTPALWDRDYCLLKAFVVT